MKDTIKVLVVVVLVVLIPLVSFGAQKKFTEANLAVAYKQQIALLEGEITKARLEVELGAPKGGYTGSMAPNIFQRNLEKLEARKAALQDAYSLLTSSFR